MTDDFNKKIYLYAVVNRDLKMGAGKIAAQVGHAVNHITEWYLQQEKPEFAKIYSIWKTTGAPKIVLKAPESILRELLGTYESRLFPIVDQGRTQVAPNSLTVIGFPLCSSSEFKELQELKLL